MYLYGIMWEKKIGNRSRHYEFFFFFLVIRGSHYTWIFFFLIKGQLLYGRDGKI